MSVTPLLSAFLGVVIVTVIVVSGLLPVVANSITGATNATGWANNFTGTSGLLNIMPLIFVAALITLIIASVFVG